jgi:ADP-heptose:LPS heptosyltransferase
MNILLRRTGALGDVIQTLPIARRLRVENPDDFIIFQTQYPQVYFGNPNVNMVAVNVDGAIHKTIDLDRSYERDTARHLVDAYMKTAFGDYGEGHDKSFEIEKAVAPVWIDDMTILFHPNVSWPNRTLKPEFWGELALRLQKKYFKVAVIGTTLDHNLQAYGVIDTRSLLSLAQQAAAIDAAACLVCGDSSMFSLVGTTETPAVGFCTISRPEYFMPFRRGKLGWNFTALNAPVECFGCRESAGDVTYLDCKFRTNACVDSFDVDEAFEAVVRAVRFDERRI